MYDNYELYMCQSEIISKLMIHILDQTNMTQTAKIDITVIIIDYR